MLVLAGTLVSPARADEPEVLPEDSPEVQRLRALATQLGDEDEARREAAYEALTTLGPDDLPAIRARVERLRRGRPPHNWAVDIMNRFRRRGAGPQGEPPDVARGALAELGRRHPHAREHARVLLMAEPLVLWRALDRMGTLEAQRAAFPLFGLDRGIFMPEARNWLRARGPDLMAAAIYARSDANRFTRRWGAFAMDALHADDPGRAIHAVSEAQLPDVLRAYAALRVQSAMRVIVSYVNSDRRAVRLAAREALAEYGGNAVWVLRTAYRNTLGERPDEALGWRGLSAAIYAHGDDRRMESVRGALERGIAARDAGDLRAMRERFDEVLSRVPELEHPAPVAEGYAALGAHHASEGRWARAGWAYRRALRLDGANPAAVRWRGELAFVDARAEAEEGVFDEAAFERVLADDPEHEGARAALASVARPSLGPARGDARARWGIAAAILLALLGLGILWRSPAPPRDDFVFDTTLGDTLDETADTTLSDSTLPG